MSHFYEKTEKGIKPRHFVPMAKDVSRTRPTRVTDVKKWRKEGRKVYPSVTTVLNMLNKEGVNQWKIDQHLQKAHEMAQKYVGNYDTFKQDVMRETREQMDQAPQAGTDIHKVLEDYIGKDIMPDDEIELKICHNVLSVLVQKTRDLSCKECEKYFARDGYAGCAH